MKKLLIMAAGLLMLSTAASAQQTEAYPSYIIVTGNAERGVSTLEDIAGLKKLGIDVDKDLQVGDMSGDLKSYVLRRDRVQTQKNYVLKVSDAATLGKVFQALAAIDISRMNLIKATRSDLEQIKLELRTEAMKNARRSADTLAEAIGQKAGSDRYGRFARIPGHENQLLGKRPVRTGITTGPQAPSPGRRGKEPPHRRPAPDTTNYGNDTP